MTAALIFGEYRNGMSGLPLRDFEERRAYECRLTPDRALETIDEAAAWIEERGLVEITPCCSLPSLHTACHEEPYTPGGRGFGA
jgi:hypothetical protein